jgi:hypothetical protein
MPGTPSRTTPLRFDDVCALAASLPGVEVGTSYGTPALTVRGRALARLREDGTTLVLKVPFVVRDHLLATAPAAYFVTAHYRGYPAVLVRLAAADPAQLAALLEEAWRQVAPKRLVRELDARRAAAPS